MLSTAEVAKMFGISKKSVRAYIPGERIGRVVRYPRARIDKLMGGGYGASPVPENLRSFPDYRRLAWEAQRFWIVNERAALCDHKANFLFSTVVGFLTENPDGDVMSDEFVAYARANSPVAGGDVGDALRADIQEEAKLRGLVKH